MRIKYLKFAQKALQEDFIDDKVIPLVPFSKNATLPKGVTMPDWNELGKVISSYISGSLTPFPGTFVVAGVATRAVTLGWLHHGRYRQDSVRPPYPFAK